jgi:hypothetical protein
MFEAGRVRGVHCFAKPLKPAFPNLRIDPSLAHLRWWEELFFLQNDRVLAAATVGE